ncbi:hypothetical protein D3C76_1563040 [compost metagenome]
MSGHPQQLRGEASAATVQHDFQRRPTLAQGAQQRFAAQLHLVQLQACAVARVDQRQGADGQTRCTGWHQEQADAVRVARLSGGARSYHEGICTQPVDHPELVAVQAIALPLGFSR